MNCVYKKVSENGDATCNYELIGEFPIKFVDFIQWVLRTENSFRVNFCATNKRYGGCFSNNITIHKHRDDDNWYWEDEDPEDLFETIANENVTKCWANGGYGQMTYFCTFEEH